MFEDLGEADVEAWDLEVESSAKTSSYFRQERPQKSIFDLENEDAADVTLNDNSIFFETQESSRPKRLFESPRSQPYEQTSPPIDLGGDDELTLFHNNSEPSPPSPVAASVQPATPSEPSEPGQLSRKFPGPAGNLPRISCSRAFDEMLDRIAENDIPDDDEDIERSNHTVAVEEKFIETETWQFMITDRGLDEAQAYESTIEKFNLKWLKKNKSLSSGPGILLHCVLIEINRSCLEPQCVFQDPSDTMEATLHQEIVELYGAYLFPGTVFVMKNMHSFAQGSNCFVTVSKANLVTIYPGCTKVRMGKEKREVSLVTSAEVKRISQEALEYERQWLSVSRPPSSTDPAGLSISSSLSSVNQEVSGQPFKRPQFGFKERSAAAQSSLFSLEEDDPLEGLDEESIFGEF